MNDDEIRVLVREAIQKHLGAGSSAAPVPPLPGVPLHPSFARYAVPRADEDSTCLIESAVRCNHCGYCQCHGH